MADWLGGFFDLYRCTAPSTFPRGSRVVVEEPGSPFHGMCGIVLDDAPHPILPGHPAAVVSLLDEAWLDEPLRFNHRSLKRNPG